MREHRHWIGRTIWINANRRARLEHCFDITDELPPADLREIKQSLFVGFCRYAGFPGFAVQVIFSDVALGLCRDLNAQTAHESNPEAGTADWPQQFVLRLKAFGLTPESYLAIVHRALAQIAATTTPLPAKSSHNASKQSTAQDI